VAGACGKAKMVAGAEVNSPRRASANAATSFMVGTSILGNNNLEAGLSGPQAEIDILERKEVRLVEQTDPLEHVAPDEHHAAADRIDRPHTIGSER